MNNNLKSTVTLELVNAVTGQVESSREETNIVTGLLHSKLLDFTTTGILSTPRIWISERRMSKTTSFALAAATPIPNAVVASQTPTVFSAIIAKTVSTPYVVEFRCQFDPATTDRTIWTLGVTNTISTANPYTLVALTTPCVQNGTSPGPGQILVVTYRIQVLEYVAQATTVPGASSIDRAVAEQIANFEYTADGTISLQSRFADKFVSEYWNTTIPSNLSVFATASRPSVASTPLVAIGTTINGYVVGSQTSTSTPVGKYQYGCNEISTTFSNTDHIGNIFGSMYIGQLNTVGIGGGGSYGATTLYAVPMTRVNWQPAQTIFSHGPSGTEPFQQVSALATGSGSVNIDGSSWTYPSWPEYHRTSIVATGSVGTARYTISRAYITGFTTNAAGTGSSWTTAPVATAILPVRSIDSTSQVMGTGMVPVQSHHNRPVHPSDVVRFFATVQSMYPIKHTVYAWDGTGVTTYNVKTEEYASWDATSVPPLPVSAVRQCSTDSNGILWVACANTGVWRVDPSGGTVANLTTFNTLTTTNAYAISVGINNTVVSIVNGGVVTSTDSGASWVVQAFTYPGISDGNWSNVRWACIQRHSPTLRMAIGTTTDTTGSGTLANSNIVWWSTSSAPVAGPIFTTAHFTSTLNINYTWFSHPRTMTASRSGNTWIAATYSGSFVLRWGSAFASRLSGRSQGAIRYRNAPDCVYDYYNSPHAGVLTKPTSQSVGSSDVTNKGMTYGTYNVSSAAHFLSAPYVELGDKVTLTRGHGGAVDRLNLWTPCPNFFGLLTTLNARVAKNIEHTGFEELMWDHYGWNGSVWTKGYHAPAVDVAGRVGGPYNGTRHRFDAESHTFTGRSLIDVPPSALASYVTSSLTVAGAITPLAPLPGQLPTRQLLSYVNQATGNRVQMFLDDGSGYMSVLAATPTQKLTTGSVGGSVNMSVGSKTFTVEAGLSYQAGMRVRMVPTVDTPITPQNNFMDGTVTSYTGTSLVVTVDYVSGAATSYSDWIIDFIGYRFGVTPTVGASGTIAVVMSASSVTCYVNGVQSGGVITVPYTFDFSDVNGNLAIGGNWTNYIDGVGFENTDGFFRGAMSNVLLDSLAWTSSEAASYHANPGTYTAGTVVVKYPLTNSLAGLESRPTHTTAEPTLDGVTIRFTNGTGTSFVTGEYYTNGVVKGILKDNATSFTHKFDAHYLPVEHGFTDITPSVIPGVGVTVTEPMYARHASLSFTNMAALPGQQLIGTGNSFSFQSSVGDFIATCVVGSDRISVDTDSLYTEFGLNDSSTTFPGGLAKWTIRFKYGAGRGVDVMYNSGIVVSNANSWAYGDTFAASRVGAVVTFARNGTVFWTSSGGQNTTARIWASTRMGDGLLATYLKDITITYARPAYVVCIGDEVGLTGKFSPTYHSTVGTRATNYVVNIQGYASPATVVLAPNTTATIDNIVNPGINTVVIAPEPGYMIFNPADVGKTVTLSCSVVYTPQ